MVDIDNGYNPQAGEQANRPESAVVVGMGTWAVRCLVMNLPVIRLIMALVWGLDDGGDRERRNFARAYLLLMALGYLLCILLFVLFYIAVDGDFSDLFSLHDMVVPGVKFTLCMA